MADFVSSTAVTFVVYFAFQFTPVMTDCSQDIASVKLIRILQTDAGLNNDSLQVEGLLQNCTFSDWFAVDLSRNNLTVLPKFVSVFESVSVHSFDFSYNELSTVETGLFSQITIRNLNLSHNSISSIQTRAFPDDLMYLNLSYNMLEVLEAGIFDHMDCLRSLDMSHNLIVNIQIGVFPRVMVSVIFVDFSFNQLTTFEPWPYLFNGHVRVNLSHNKISRFTNERNMTYDRELIKAEINLTHNNLTRLNLSQYHQGRHPNSIEIRNHWLKLADNPWICDCELYPFVKAMMQSFIVEYNDYVKAIVCDSPAHLRDRSLNYLVGRPNLLVCQVEELCPPGCKCQDRPHDGYILVECDPSEYAYTQLPRQLPPEKPLYLNLSRHMLHELHHPPSYVSRLYSLDLSRNKLTYLSSSFLTFATNLVLLYVSENLLTTLPQEIRRLSLENMQLQGNPFVCSCDFIWFGDWIKGVGTSLSVENSSVLVEKFPTAKTLTESAAPVAHPTLLSRTLPPGEVTFQCVVENGGHLPVVDMSVSRLGCGGRLNVSLLIGGCSLVLIVFGTITCWQWRYEVKIITFWLFPGGRPCFRGRAPHDRRSVNDQRPSDDAEIGMQPNRNSAHEGAAFRYDVYMSVDEDDDEALNIVTRVLLPLLEGRQLRVYLPIRQELPGANKADSRIDCIISSRSVLVVLSERYAQNKWCRHEFDHASRHLQGSHCGHLVILVIANITIGDNDQRGRRRVRMDHSCCGCQRMVNKDVPGDHPSKDDPTEHDVIDQMLQMTEDEVNRVAEKKRHSKEGPHYNVDATDDESECFRKGTGGFKVRRAPSQACMEALTKLSRYLESNGRPETVEPLNTYLTNGRYLSLEDRFLKQKLLYELTR